MRVAAIDIGTNSVLLTVVERDSAGNCLVLSDRATITRLGQGVDRTRQLASDAIERTLACLQSYAGTLGDLRVDQLAVVGTSALRDAGNADLFTKRAIELLGVAPRVVEGTVEAELTFRGALSGLDITGPVSVIDVGGGSTEVIAGQASAQGSRANAFRSIDVGCVRLTERYVSTDPPTAAALDAIAESTRAAMSVVDFVATNSRLVAVAGTATTLAAMQLELASYDSTKVHGCVLEFRDLDSLTKRLSHASHAERCHFRGLDPKRADVIVTGSVILTTLLVVFGHECVTVSDRGVRFGLIDEMLGSGDCV
jgi:exopolyphosphatase / guanosine-5'-triphosphate,3'-diphosphate pyrophosphatase